MLGMLAKIVSRASSDTVTKRWHGFREQGPDGTESGGSGDVESTLYECQSCNIVYVAEEKTDCGNCDGTVEPIQNAPDDTL